MNRNRRALAVATAAMATAVLASCSDQEQRQDVRKAASTTVARLQDALAAKDWRTICRFLTRPAQEEAGTLGHGLPTVLCEKDVRRAFGIIERGGGLSGASPVLSSVVASAGGATATVASRERPRWKAEVPIARGADNWKLAGFLGAAPGAVETIEETARARPFPKPRGRPVKVVDGDGRPCPDLDESRYPDISGGCSFRVLAGRVPVRMLTAFGDLEFADCRIFYRVSVDAAGRTWTDGWGAADVDKPGCSDIDPCKAGPFDLHPWKGRLTRDPRGGYLHVMDMCLRTCVGSFTGELVMRLTRHGDRWRFEQTNQGASGFMMDGPLATPGDAFAVR